MKKTLLRSLGYLFVLTLILGVFYPLVVTDLSMLLFPVKAKGSLIIVNDTVVGSAWIGQEFDRPGYFSSRPSAVGYNPLPGSGSNLGPLSRKLRDQVQERRKRFSKWNGVTDTLSIPSEMLFASASGLDPHISPEAAMLQVERVARERGFTPSETRHLRQLVSELAESPQFFVFGEPRINVLRLNLKLDNLRHE
jgi:potassium-transporting ATPase KdpC subunit